MTRAFDECFKFGPSDVRMNAPAKAAICSCDDAFTANNIGVFHYQFSDVVGMLNHVRRMTDDTRHEKFVVRNLRIGPYAPVMTVPYISGFDLITLHIHFQQCR